MVDVVSAEVRSRMMAGIRARDTRPEMVLRRALHGCGIRFRLHRKDLPGTPDLVFPRYNAVAFVHGCFWHRHAGCRYASTPSTRADFWLTKFDANVARDKRSEDALAKLGWRVAIVWECALRSDAKGVVAELQSWLSVEPGSEGYARIYLDPVNPNRLGEPIPPTPLGGHLPDK